jgi:uncharacterized OB-fold protein
MTDDADHFRRLVRPELDYFDHLTAGRFMLARNIADRRCFFPPRVAAPQTGETDIDWVEASGRGTVYSTSVVRQRPPTKDYNVALIDLDEGPRMMARVEGIPPDEVRIGMRVLARIVREDDRPLVVFNPA